MPWAPACRFPAPLELRRSSSSPSPCSWSAPGWAVGRRGCPSTISLTGRSGRPCPRPGRRGKTLQTSAGRHLVPDLRHDGLRDVRAAWPAGPAHGPRRRGGARPIRGHPLGRGSGPDARVRRGVGRPPPARARQPRSPRPRGRLRRPPRLAPDARPARPRSAARGLGVHPPDPHPRRRRPGQLPRRTDIGVSPSSSSSRASWAPPAAVLGPWRTRGSAGSPPRPVNGKADEAPSPRRSKRQHRDRRPATMREAL